jgi:NCAIR mutase (PurE)-related protein
MARAIRKLDRRARYYADARIVAIHAPSQKPQGHVLVVSAGTADVPVAEEARVTAEVMGSRVERLYDVGVAGLHRLLGRKERLFDARVIIVVAGMDGALPSVVGGLVQCPVIAVPTSSGYGASFGGLSALLTMLNSCAAGVGVMNIDNGFGAGSLAHRINTLGVTG